jgi:hypothetical protein
MAQQQQQQQQLIEALIAKPTAPTPSASTEAVLQQQQHFQQQQQQQQQQFMTALITQQQQQQQQLLETIFANPTPASGTDRLAATLEGQEERRLQPWRGQFEVYQVLYKTALGETLDDLQGKFLDQAKLRSLSADDCWLLSLLLFASEDDRRFVASCLLSLQGADRMVAHNWHTAQAHGQQFLARHGGTISALGAPLFPADKRFSALNESILQQGVGPVGGGGDGPSCFRRGPAPPTSTFRTAPGVFRTNLEAGEFWLPISSHGGVPAVDMTVVDDVVRGHNEELQRLRAEVQRLRGRPTADYYGASRGVNRGGHRGRGWNRPRGGEGDAVQQDGPQQVLPPPPPATSAAAQRPSTGPRFQ